MDTLEYSYSEKKWRPSPTAVGGDCFFHSVFGTRDGYDQPYFDKYVKFRRMYWSAFLTYHDNGNKTTSLLELLTRCFFASHKYHHKSVNNPSDYNEYVRDVVLPEYWVQVEEISILAALENIRIVLFINTREKPNVFEPNPEILDNFPFRSVNVIREVVICLVDNHFSRLNSSSESITKGINLPIDVMHYNTFIQGTTESNSNQTQNFARKRRYKKRGGNTGIEGSFYQINLLTMVLLNGLMKFENWRLSTEDENAGKFDDLIFECFPWESAILLQAKHKNSNTWKITYDELVSTSPKSEFSLAKYFFSYQEVRGRFEVQNVVICTNARFDEKLEGILNQQSLSSNNVLHFEGGENIYYTFTGCFPRSELKQNIKKYYVRNLKDKKIIISDEDINDFLSRLKFFPNCLGEENLHNVKKKTVSRVALSENMDSAAIFDDIHKKMVDWFQEQNGRYLTQVEAKAFFADLRSSRYCESLKVYDIAFEKNDLHFSFQSQQKHGKKCKNRQQQNGNGVIPLKDAKRISHIIPEKEYILNVIKIYQAVRELQEEHKVKSLFVNSEESVDVQMQIIDAFAVPHYTFLVMICHRAIDENITRRICNRIMEILNDYKHKNVILIAKEWNPLATQMKNENVNFYEAITENIMFTHLTTSTQEKFKCKRNIIFQGDTMSLEELLTPSTIDDLNQIVNSEMLVKLARNDKIEVGLELNKLDNFYIHRSFNRNGQNIPEEKMCGSGEITEERVILISDSAGMGKSTVLTSLAISIRKHDPRLWVIRFDLNSYTNIMRTSLKPGTRPISITNLLDSQKTSKLKSDFEKKLFMKRERIVLMLDGVDEVCPRYKDFVINLLKDSLAQNNLAKIFVTARPHLCEELEHLLELQAFTLEPFSRIDQIVFLKKYWTEKLNLQDDIKKRKCEIYAEALIRKMSRWINERAINTFAGVPLQTRMLAEIFQEQNQVSNKEFGVWEGCKEFFSSDDEEPRLPKRMNLIQLYEMFIDKKRDIFIYVKGNPGGSTAADEALEEKFEKCQDFHLALALTVIFESDKCNIFTCYRNIKWPIAGNCLLRAGIVHFRGDTMYFIHRTFAEYFVARCLLIELKCEPVNKAFQELLMNHILLSNKFYVIRAFFDSFIRKDLNYLAYKLYPYLFIDNKSTYLYLFAREGCARILDFCIKCMNLKNKSQEKAPCKFANITNSDGDTLLHVAAYNGHIDVIKTLIEKGANVNIGNKKGDTALNAAVLGGSLETVKYLVDETGAKIVKGLHTLLIAAQLGHLKLVKYLSEYGVDSTSLLTTALHGAAFGGHLELVKFLVEEVGVKVNVKDIKGGTPLHLAAYGGHIEVVKFLVNAARPDTDECTVLNAAAYRGNLEVVKFLINEAGLNVNHRDRKGWTALHSSAYRGHLDIVKFLVDEANAEVNVRGVDGRTALHAAAQGDHLNVVQFLVKRNCDINVTGEDGKTILSFYRSCADVINCLKKRGVDINVKKPYMESILDNIRILK